MGQFTRNESVLVVKPVVLFLLEREVLLINNLQTVDINNTVKVCLGLC